LLFNCVARSFTRQKLFTCGKQGDGKDVLS